MNESSEKNWAREDALAHLGGLKLCEVDTGITYWMAMREGTEAEARALIEAEYGPGIEDTDGEFEITEMTREAAMRVMFCHDEVPLRREPMWMLFFHRTEPGVLACSEY